MARDTREQAKIAYLELAREGTKPTIEGIRTKIGGGGTDLINRVLREMDEWTRKIIAMPDMPADLGIVMLRLWESAVESATATFEAQHADLTQRAEAAEASQRETEKLLAELQPKLEALTAQLAERATEVATLTSKLEDSKTAREELASRCAELVAAVGKHDGEMAVLKGKLEAVTDERNRVLASMEKQNDELVALSVKLAALQPSKPAAKSKGRT